MLYQAADHFAWLVCRGSGINQTDVDALHDFRSDLFNLDINPFTLSLAFAHLLRAVLWRWDHQRHVAMPGVNSQDLTFTPTSLWHLLLLFPPLTFLTQGLCNILCTQSSLKHKILQYMEFFHRNSLQVINMFFFLLVCASKVKFLHVVMKTVDTCAGLKLLFYKENS